jgi:hypothetical protein
MNAVQVVVASDRVWGARQCARRFGLQSEHKECLPAEIRITWCPSKVKEIRGAFVPHPRSSTRLRACYRCNSSCLRARCGHNPSKKLDARPIARPGARMAEIDLLSVLAPLSAIIVRSGLLLNDAETTTERLLSLRGPCIRAH